LASDEEKFGKAAAAALRLEREEYERIRKGYVGLLDAALESARLSLGRSEELTAELDKVATEIRNREISPSFAVLDETCSRYQSVQERLMKIAFS
jgi:hypothetical protein